MGRGHREGGDTVTTCANWWHIRTHRYVSIHDKHIYIVIYILYICVCRPQGEHHTDTTQTRGDTTGVKRKRLGGVGGYTPIITTGSHLHCPLHTTRHLRPTASWPTIQQQTQGNGLPIPPRGTPGHLLVFRPGHVRVCSKGSETTLVTQ